ncbi:alpha/beta fold hydrolase [Rhodococcus jostii]|nr:alpha/beta hydrolase [Rhodococcus jostii]
MLVHGFPQNWWAWQELIGPLAADGYRVLCPDLRGAGWSSAPDDRYYKSDMADDLAVVLDRIGVAPVRVVAHDWGGPVAGNLLLRHPERCPGFRTEHRRAVAGVRSDGGPAFVAVLVSDPDFSSGDRAASSRRPEGALLGDARSVGRCRVLPRRRLQALCASHA